MAEGSGSWLEYISFYNETTKADDIWWTIDLEKPEWCIPSDDSNLLLESDSSLREDVRYIREKRYEPADQKKQELEERQRRDQALRLGASKKRL